jgi:hypothetical protein
MTAKSFVAHFLFFQSKAQRKIKSKEQIYQSTTKLQWRSKK